MNNDFALIIGINDYTPPNLRGLKSLNGAINDANHFEQWILNLDGGNVPVEHCFKIISNPSPLKPIQDEIDEVITGKIIPQIGALGGRAKRLYFYFAGHGLGSMNNTNDNALCLANWSELNRNKALSSEGYREVLKQFGYFEEIIFLADCCRNTKINVTPMHPSFAPPIPGVASGATKMFMGYATQYQDQSFEIEEENSEKRGVFTKVLINGLNGAAANEKGVITADSLRDFLIMQTPLEAQKKGYKQIPDINHSFTSTTPLIKLQKEINTITCKITFTNTRNNKVELLDNSGIIDSFDASQQKNIEIALSKGLYLLKDTISEDKYTIHVLALDQNINVHF